MARAEAINAIQSNFRGIIDSTLREGEQFAGRGYYTEQGETVFAPAEFTPQQAADILCMLKHIGVQYAEVPNPLAQGMDTFITTLASQPDRPRLLTHIRNRSEDLQAAQTVGVEGVNFLTTVDETRLKQMNLSLPEYLEQLQANISQAQETGLETRVSVEHTSDADLHKAMQVYQLADSMKVNRVGIADTRGVWTHWEVAEIVKDLATQLTHAKIEVHFHNDFLSAVANTMEALVNGASWPDTTLGGFGERTGITPLSVLLARLYQLHPDLVKQYNLSLLKDADMYVANALGVELPVNLITAPNAFAHKAGIHLSGVMNIGPSLYEPIPPSTLGNHRHLRVGTRISGRTTSSQAKAFLERQ